MTLTSLNYFAFIILVYLVYLILPHRKQNILLLVASYIFYATWDIRFLFLIILSTAINYCCGYTITNGRLTARARATTTAWIILSCFFFVVLPWEPLALHQGDVLDVINWGSLTAMSEGWGIFLGVTTLTLLLNGLNVKKVRADKQKQRRVYLIAGVAANLLILCVFKYYNFFLENVAYVLMGLGADPSRYYLHILLPVGISFYTFKGIGYLADVYREEIKAEKNYHDFALFTAFFPALLAGPIDRAKGLLPQLSVARKITTEKTLRGLHLIFYGLFKKIVIADGVVRTVNSVYGSSGQPSWIDVIVATVLFTIQIYCDFSGYTDVARGTAKLFGIDLMINFKVPYFAKNPQEFWSRWHISLSTWLRDYLYVPLGGNRHGTGMTYRNLMLTMALGGLWHGAAWNFVLWGIYHGLLLCLYRAAGAVKEAVETRKSLFADVPKILFFFVLICYGWLIFRAPSLTKIASLSSTLIADFGNMTLSALRPRAAAAFGLPIFLCIEFVEYAARGRSFYKSMPVPAWTALYAAMIFCLIIGMSTESAKFIYFNF